MSKARVRFAPSPTGFLHIGTTRTALFNWLFARREGGTFILRVEDTDRERSKKEYLDEILNSLTWLGISWDEGPYFQSQRTDLYRKFSEKLLSSGMAREEAGAVIFTVPSQKEIVIDDILHGRISFDAAVLKDIVIIKSDGTPTYNFACVVDDGDMGITHVIRGDDHISNTPKQILLYEALGFEMPRFAHIPLIVDEDRAKLSKRHGAESLAYYREKGFLPEALVNYLILLGWSPGDDREIISLEEASKLFSLEKVNKTAAAFGLDKLKWMNKAYIKSAPVEKLCEELTPFLAKKGYSLEGREEGWFPEVVALYRERFETFVDFVAQTKFFFADCIEYSEEARASLEDKGGIENVRILGQRLEALSSFDTQSIEAAIRGVANERGVRLGDIAQPLRAAVTGHTASPGIFGVVYLLGREKIFKRICEALEMFGNKI